MGAVKMATHCILQSTLFREAKPQIVITNKNTSDLYIKQFHYLGEKGSIASIIHALVINGQIEGIAEWKPPSAPETVVGAFGLQRNEQQDIYELGRFVLRENLPNRASMFLGRSIRKLKQEQKPRAIITYADERFHVGLIYQATNFHYFGLTAPKSDFYINGKIQERGKTKGVKGEWKPRPRKHRYAIVFDKSLNICWVKRPYPKMPFISSETKEAIQ